MAENRPTICPICKTNNFLSESRGMVFKKTFFICKNCETELIGKSKGNFRIETIPEKYSNVRPYYLGKVVSESEMETIPALLDSELEKLSNGEQPLMDDIRSDMRELIDFEIPIFLKKGEELNMALPLVSLFEERSTRVSSGSRAGFRVMKGVYVSQSISNPEYEQVIKKIDEGSLIVTNKRYVFTGEKRNIDQSLDKITSVMIFNDAISVARSNKQKTEYFSGSYYFPLIGAFLKGVVTQFHK